jgi:hypothetical protein
MGLFGRRRRRYRVVLHGADVCIPLEDETRPIIGFYATRFVRATTPEQASAAAITILRNAWFNSPYSTVDRSGGPAITVKEVELIRNPFRRSRPNRGYQFYQSEESPDDIPGLPPFNGGTPPRPPKGAP